MTTQEQAIRELAIRQLEKRHADKRESLLEFVKYYRQVEKKVNLDMNRHIELICEKLEAVARGEIKRLMINIPPRALKTELVSIAFPAWCLGNKGSTKFMGISYSSGLSQDNSSACRAMYQSDTYKTIFPRVSQIKEDQNTKQYWTTTNGGQYYASGSTGTITGKGCDIMLIDDPLKPDDVDSDLKRTAVNNNYHNTLESRLNSKTDGAIVIIMQRLHDDDLCGHLLDLESKGTGEVWEKVIVPAIATQQDEHRNVGESFFQKRFPIEILHKLKASQPQTFSTQYQQEPVDESTQEFHMEWFKYHGEETGNKTPTSLRIFTAVDPAFKQNQHNDNSSIITAGFVNDSMYILEYTQGKFTPDVLLEKIIYHIQKWGPEKTGIEAFQAQSMILTFLKNELNKRGIHTVLEEIRQTGDKETKIRRLVPLYKNGLIYHKRGMDALEHELLRFPRGKHDDIIDSEQMLYDMYTLHPNTVDKVDFRIEYDNFGRPIIV